MHQVRVCASAGAWLVFAIVAGAQSTDPAGLMPVDTPVFVEIRESSVLAGLLGKSPMLSASGVPYEHPVRKRLEALARGDARRIALGMSPALIGASKWTAVVETASPEAALAMFESWTTEPISSRSISGLVVLANNDKAIAEAVELAGGKGESLASRADFKAFRAAHATDAPVRFHVDLQNLWPRPVRGVRNSSNLWSVLFGCHVNHVLKTAGFLSGELSRTSDAVSASISGDIRATDSRAVTEGNPVEGIIAAPQDVAFRVSVPRNLANFWTRRSQLFPEPGAKVLVTLEARAPSALGGCGVEKLVSELGEAFDLYIAPSDAPADPGQRVPAMALVATVRDLSPCEYESLRKFLRLVAATVAGEDPPPTCEQIRRWRGADLFVNGAAVPVIITKVRGRVILSNDEALTTRLVDSAIDRPLLTRAAGDEIVVDGPRLARVIREARAILSSGWLLDRMGEPRTRATLDMLESVLPEVREGRIAFDLDGKRVKLEIRASGPAFWTETRPAAR